MLFNMTFKLSALIIITGMKKTFISRLKQEKMKINPVINFAISTALLASITLTGCFGQRIYVYEKIPEASECRRYTEYFQVSKCNRKHHFTMSKKLYRTIQTTNYHFKKKFNQKVKCTQKNNRPIPTACYETHLPSRFNLPTYGKTAD